MASSIKGVAQRAGVSPSTVSKVLNASPNFSASVETRQRIQQAALELRYVPNRMAQSLGRGKSDVIGLVVSGLKNPFFAELAESLESLVTDEGYHALIEIMPEVGSHFTQNGNLSGWLLDGMIVWATPWQAHHTYERSYPYSGPVVYMGHPRTNAVDWVAFDLYGGGRLITEHVYDSGRKNVWHLTPFVERVDIGRQDRTLGFLDVSRERGMPGHIVTLMRGEEGREVGIEMAATIAQMPHSERPDALICHNDVIATGVFHGLRRFGIRVPEDIAVTGFDGLAEGQCLDKPLTTIRVPSSAMAQSAWDILQKRLNTQEEVEPQQVLLAGELLVGGTT